MNKEGCIGCTSISTHEIKCYALGQQYHDCPCKECLVKVTCQIRCSELNDFEYSLKRAAQRVADRFWV